MQRTSRLELNRLQYNSVQSLEIKKAERTGTEPRPTEEILIEVFKDSIVNEAEEAGYNILTPLEDINPDMRWVEVLPAKDRVPAVQHFFLEATYETDEQEEPVEAPSEPVETTEEAE